MSSLPEELWSRILEIGIEKSNFSHKDLCCISISCRLLHRLSSDDSLWNFLFSDDDFPPSTSHSSKYLYQLRFEREKREKDYWDYHIARMKTLQKDIESKRESITVHETGEVLSSV
ncbi:unnamed protein product [Trifolium pratense]|uniref:Uncharacterized protein n=1 Tax=Trifolium pratense TaxID=57577 RepID=A0ACB0JAD9_TRIPR|nr:unnamed protein product [Trifolium pratense]